MNNVKPAPLPHAAYRPGQRIKHDGREWLIIGVAHTGQHLTLRTEDGLRPWCECRVEVKQTGT